MLTAWASLLYGTRSYGGTLSRALLKELCPLRIPYMGIGYYIVIRQKVGYAYRMGRPCVMIWLREGTLGLLAPKPLGKGNDSLCNPQLGGWLITK